MLLISVLGGQAAADDLGARAALVESTELDALDYHRHPDLVDAAAKAASGLDTTLNALGLFFLIARIAKRFEAQDHGLIAVIAS